MVSTSGAMRRTGFSSFCACGRLAAVLISVDATRRRRRTVRRHARRSRSAPTRCTSPTGRAHGPLAPRSRAPTATLTATLGGRDRVSTGAIVTALIAAGDRGAARAPRAAAGRRHAQRAARSRTVAQPPPRAGACSRSRSSADRQAVTDEPIVAGASRSRPLAPPQICRSARCSAESEIRVRFDEPMVAVAAVGTAGDPPVATITPAIAGSWRWVDTRVAQFTAKAAAPAAGDGVHGDGRGRRARR